MQGGDWVLLRTLRLRALADAPTAFASSRELEVAHPQSYWREVAAQSELGAAVVFVAGRRERRLGMVGARWFDRERGIVQLWGMWVAPEARRRGTGERLVGAVHDWAASGRARAVRLGVIPGSSGSQGFYERLGFAPTGETRVLGRDEKLTALFLSRPV